MVRHTNSKPFGIRKHPALEFLKNLEKRPLKTVSKFCELSRTHNTMKKGSHDLRKKIFLYKSVIVNILFLMKKIHSLLKKWTLLSNLPKSLHSSKNNTILRLLLEGSIFELFQKFFFELFSTVFKLAVCVPQSVSLKNEGMSKD